MSHEPGRERHMQYQCECCGLRTRELYYQRRVDEYWCQACINNLTAIDEKEESGDEVAPSQHPHE